MSRSVRLAPRLTAAESWFCICFGKPASNIIKYHQISTSVNYADKRSQEMHGGLHNLNNSNTCWAHCQTVCQVTDILYELAVGLKLSQNAPSPHLSRAHDNSSTMLVYPASRVIVGMSSTDLPLSQQRTSSEATPAGKALLPALLHHDGSLRDTVVIQTPSPISSRYFDSSELLATGAWTPSPEARQVPMPHLAHLNTSETACIRV